MPSTTSRFDLALGYAQWQGSGRHDNLPRGANAAAEVCGRFAPLVAVPVASRDGDAHGVRRWEAIFDQFRAAREILRRNRPKRLLTAGGDCAADIASIDYLNAICPDLTVIWIDAHLDANTPETSPSGSFHGMPISAIMGRAPEPMRRLMGSPVDPARFFYHGIRVGDDGDLAFQRERGLAMLDPERLAHGHVHIHFDLDVLDPAEFPHLAYTDGALGIDEAVTLVGRIAREGDLVGLTVTEFSPADEQEARDGSRVIERLCEAATGA